MRIFLSLLMLFLGVTKPIYADTPTPDFGFLFNRLPGQPLARKYGLGDKIREAHGQAICVYDYATSGGAVGTIVLKATDLVTPCGIPGKAIIVNAWVNSTTAMVSTGSATVALQTHGASADILAATGKASFTTSAIIQGIPVWSDLTKAIKLGAGTATAPLITIDAVVAVTALTAGHFRVFINYALGE
jgi:hypothetical protein